MDRWKAYAESADFRASVNAVVAWFSERPGFILDIDCGDGLVLYKVYEAEPKRNVEGIDRNWQALQPAFNKLGSLFPLQTKELHELDDRSADYVLASVEWQMDELARIARKGVYVTVNNIVNTPTSPTENGLVEGVYKVPDHDAVLRKFFDDVERLEIGGMVHFRAWNKKKKSLFSKD